MLIRLVQFIEHFLDFREVRSLRLSLSDSASQLRGGLFKSVKLIFTLPEGLPFARGIVLQLLLLTPLALVSVAHCHFTYGVCIHFNYPPN